MAVINIKLRFRDSDYPLEVDTSENFELLRFQVFSLTLVPPEKQKFIGIPELNSESLLSELHLVDGQELILLEVNEEKQYSDSCNRCDSSSKKNEHAPAASLLASQNASSIKQSDEELARLLQEEEDKALASSMVQNDHISASFMSRISSGLNSVMQYERDEFKAKALSVIPVDQLDEQATIYLAKSGKELTDDEFKDAFLIQLLKWFKGWFSWVDTLPCEICKQQTRHFGMAQPTSEELRYQGSRVEIHRCERCSRNFRFVRYNDPTKLLETRRGRCGEWANCFSLICRSLGYDTRKVEDWTDHVWTECYSNKLSRWVHLDPCEIAFDKPLLYESGWGKKLSYVFAFSCEGVRDVIFRYTRKWNEVKHRRNILPEDTLTYQISLINEKIFLSLPASRLNRYLQEDSELKSYLSELDKKDVFLPGRITGSLSWRISRGEMGVDVSEKAAIKNESIENKTEILNSEKHACDDHVGRIRNALSDICNHIFQENNPASSELENGISVGKDPEYCRDLLLRVLNCASDAIRRMKALHFKTRYLVLEDEKSNSANSKGFDIYEAFAKGKIETLMEAMGITATLENTESTGKHKAILDGKKNYVQLSLSIPFAEETLNSVIPKIESMKRSNQIFTAKGIFWAANRIKVSGGFVSASSENLPNEIALNAFDGMNSSKWLHHNAIKEKTWIMYRLKNGTHYALASYLITSADDCPSRDPASWILEGSSNGGISWTPLNKVTNFEFEKRFLKRKFDIETDKQIPCNAWRWTFLALNDPHESILQLSCIDMYAVKGISKSAEVCSSEKIKTSVEAKNDTERRQNLFADLCKQEFAVIVAQNKTISPNEAAKLALEKAQKKFQSMALNHQT